MVTRVLPFRVGLLIFILSPPLTAAAEDAPRMPDTDRIRLAEAFRIAHKLGDRVWDGWRKAPFAALLITPDYEFLVGHPSPPVDFKRLGSDPLLNGDVYFRKRVFQIELQATFPLNGVATIVIGQAENTMAKTSTPWVVTLLHEHFHQLQYSQPDYYSQAAALGLARGDETGMWMLNYPFPYTDEKVDKAFGELGPALAAALESGGTKQFPKKFSAYLAVRKNLARILSPDDYKYLSFQLWQEGIARYTEHRVARLAGSRYTPTKEFRSLNDFSSFNRVASSILKRIKTELAEISLSKRQRVAFYSIGAAEGMLGDLSRSKWQRRYLVEKFSTESFLANH